MLAYLVFSFLIKLSVVKTKDMCNNDYRHMNNTQIDVSKFCSSNTCIVKCCDEGEMFAPTGYCSNTVEMFQSVKNVSKLISDVDYSKIVLFSWDGSVKKKLEKDFVFITNQINVKSCTFLYFFDGFFILEDGAVRYDDELWPPIEKLKYCIDFKLTSFDEVKLVLRENILVATTVDQFQSKYEHIVLVVMLVSSFFLLVVLVVYCLLPELQNLMGLVLIAYTLSNLVTTLANVVALLSNEKLTTYAYHCKILTPMMYFTAVSSIFWMNVMSFDVWWLLRGHRKRCDINRRGERVKFMWYSLYAWGIPLLMTALVTTLDYIDLSRVHFPKPNFKDCYFFLIGGHVYYHIPMGILIFVNILFFSLTLYNIWMTKRAVNKRQDSRSSTPGTNRFVTYMKLFVVMGVSLFLDLIPMDEFWVYILTTTYNRLIGVFLFFLFVFNKRIFFKLCKRFNVNISPREPKLGNRTARSTQVTTKDENHEIDPLQNRPKEENIIE